MAKHPKTAGHVPLPAVTIGALSVTLAAGLSMLGALARLDLGIAALLANRGGPAIYQKAPPLWLVWLATVLLASGLAFAILSVPGTWRRVVLWITTVVLVAGWAPVLALAAHAPSVGAPLIAVVWSGVCALVYSNNHRMPVDENPAEKSS